MKKFIILTKDDISEIEKNKPVLIDIDDFTYILCSDEYYENRKSIFEVNSNGTKE